MSEFAGNRDTFCEDDVVVTPSNFSYYACSLCHRLIYSSPPSLPPFLPTSSLIPPHHTFKGCSTGTPSSKPSNHLGLM